MNNEHRQVRRYWIRDVSTELKERTAVTKMFEDAVGDIAAALSISKNQASVRLLNKGSLESKFQAWVLIPEVKNPFAADSKKTPLV